MTNITEQKVEPDNVFVGHADELPETLTVAVAGTAASITSDNAWAVSDLDGLTLLITITGVAEQTVTFPASTTTALQVAAAINAQSTGLSADVVATDVVITTDAVGSDQTITLDGTATDITWETVVAGTGVSGSLTLEPGVVVARTTSGTAPYTAGDIVYYQASGGPTGADEPIGVLNSQQVFASSGSKGVNISYGGRAIKGKLITHAGTALSVAELDKLVKNSNIELVAVQDLSNYQTA